MVFTLRYPDDPGRLFLLSVETTEENYDRINYYKTDITDRRTTFVYFFLVGNSESVENRSMFRYILLILSFAFNTHYVKADEYIEYNKWYSKDGVLYDIANTKDGDPVMLSIYAPGKKNANMVVSYYSQGVCEKNINTLKIDANDFPAQYVCIQEKNGKINHYTVTDADSVNYMIDRLTSGLTIVLQDNIKVWRGNFDNPKFGVAPNFW